MLEIDNNMLEIPNPQKQVNIKDAKGRYLPGYSGNPGGKPIGTLSLVGILRKQLTEHPEDAQAIVTALITMGKTRELGAIKELLDRIDGKVAERHKIDMEMPVKLVFVPAETLLKGHEASQDNQDEALED